jgi:hypothetical protein
VSWTRLSPGPRPASGGLHPRPDDRAGDALCGRLQRQGYELLPLRVAANTFLGVAGYRSGWYPGRSVDRLFGEVSSESAPAELQARTELETQIINKVKETHQAWLEEAKKPDADPALLDQLNEARRRVLAYPAFKPEPFKDTIEIEYNPGRELATFHIDDKLLFVLASNPDDVVRAIASFVEEDKTVLTINRLAGTITQGLANDLAGRKATQEVDKANDAKLRQVLKQTVDAIADGTPKARAVGQIDVLTSVLDAVNP